MKFEILEYLKRLKTQIENIRNLNPVDEDIKDSIVYILQYNLTFMNFHLIENIVNYTINTLEKSDMKSQKLLEDIEKYLKHTDSVETAVNYYIRNEHLPFIVDEEKYISYEEFFEDDYTHDEFLDIYDYDINTDNNDCTFSYDL